MSKQINPASAKRLISNALAKDIKKKPKEYRKKLYTKMAETQSAALKYGVDTRKTSYITQGFIIQNLAYAMKYYRDNKLI